VVCQVDFQEKKRGGAVVTKGKACREKKNGWKKEVPGQQPRTAERICLLGPVVSKSQENIFHFLGDGCLIQSFKRESFVAHEEDI
jgi:hypothetical protein